MKRHLWKLMSKTRADRLGPGLITGAADDDPSGIATYSQAGAQFGFGMLWTVVFTFPLMTAIQMVSARIGHITGHGLTANIKRAFPRWVTLSIVVLLVCANTLNVSADIAAMGEAVQLLAGGSALIYSITFGLLCLVLQVFLPYRSYVRWLKWLTLALLSYVAVVFTLDIDWAQVAWSVILPPMVLSKQSLLMIVAVFGTTISPYLFFWQAAQEMEDVRAADEGPPTVASVRSHLRRIKWDTIIGMAVSNIIAFFIILSTAVTLHAHGARTIDTAAQAAEALRPLAGDFTFAVFSLGIIGTGLLAVPVLAGSAAYAAAEAMGFEGSLSSRLEHGEGKGFYSIIALSTLGGVVLTLSPSDAVQELFWAAVLNGVIAVPIMVVMMLLAGRQDIMGTHTVNGRLRMLGWLSTAVMAAAVVGMLWMS
jgi:NRAMP (natural resistance-associated macrophage protein)-like metal ion transporter